MKYIDICIALYDYQSHNDEELSFNADDTLYIIHKDSSDWYKAQLKTKNTDGRIGLVPSNYIKKSRPICILKALYDYQAHSSEELTFKENDTMTLYDKDDQDWYLAETKGGEIGLVPSNYVEESTISADTTNVSSPICNSKWAIALYNFDPQDKEETQLKEHEQVLVVDYVSNHDWWTIEHKDGTSGIVPATYLKFQDEYEAPLEKGKEEEQKIIEEEEIRRIARMREKEEKEKSRQAEAERRRKMQEEAKQREIETKKRQAAALAASLENNSPRRSQIPAPLPPVNASLVQNQSMTPHDPNKPDVTRIRWWTDRTGAFKVEAQLLAYSNGKIRLFKTNGVKIDVPVEKMCIDDLKYVEQETGQKLLDDNTPLSHFSKGFSWFNYFKKINIPYEASARYAKAFEKATLGERDIERLTYGRMKALGMAENHVRRFQRFIETNQVEPLSDDENSKPKLKVKKSVTFGPVTYIEDHAVIEVSDDEDGNYINHDAQWQIDQDEMLARKLQEQENEQNGRAQSTLRSVGLHRRGTGRPTPSHSTPKSVEFTGFNQTKQEILKPIPAQPEMQPLQPSPVQRSLPISQPQIVSASSNTAPLTSQSGFDDDAWAPRPSHSPSTKPLTFNTISFANSVVNNTPPQPPQRPIPQTSQQSLADPQPFAKWGESPSAGHLSVSAPATTNSPLVFSQPNSFANQNKLQPLQQSTTNTHNSLTTGNNSFIGSSPSLQHQQLTQFASSSPYLQHSTSNLSMHSVSIPIQSGLSPSMTSQPPINVNPLQPQLTAASTPARNWENATPNNPFGNRILNNNSTPTLHSNFQSQTFNTSQTTGYSTSTMGSNDKYAIFKTIDTSAPSILKPTTPFQQQQTGFVQMQPQQHNSIFTSQQQRW
ncbi:hypothetical protein G6F64_000291 [Rhizopus arrhizus]|uniref:Actin cytoskeleton-regulatory complex protein SLA1 n=1 Tax=Rhizopus oryzae TaxID=64495 RepID=A0A9P7BY62_RHIOR|nr:hypothetical protein G6F64_000291 [Rhizopus arrhizus]